MRNQSQQSEINLQEIVVYANRTWVLFYTLSLVGCWLSSLVGTLFLLGSFFFFREFAFSQTGLTLEIVAFIIVIVFLIMLSIMAESDFLDFGDSAILAAIVMLFYLVAGGWLSWRAICQLHENQPALRVNHEKIVIGARLKEESTSFYWKEIEAIYLHTIGKHAQIYLRFIQDKAAVQSTDALLKFHQRHLDQALPKIIEQIHSAYASEIQEHHVMIVDRCL